MDVKDQMITSEYAIYNGDCLEVAAAMPSESIHLAIYSPPFAIDGAGGGGGCLYTYSSSDRDFSNARTYAEFFEQYEFLVREIHRMLLPGRITAVHCTDIPLDGANVCGYSDFPGDIIRLHQKIGFWHKPRRVIWKEPLAVRNRTMSKALAHRQLVEDSTLVNCASADYLLEFRKKGDNAVPVTHDRGLMRYCGEREIPRELLKLRGYQGNQIKNRYSHWIWRQYASSIWDDIRIDRVLKYREARDAEDEKHLHPLQLDVIERAVELWTNPGEKVFTPFMGVGSEVFGAVTNGRKGVGAELKNSYFRQAVKNLASVGDAIETERSLLDGLDDENEDDADPIDEEIAAVEAEE